MVDRLDGVDEADLKENDNITNKWVSTGRGSVSILNLIFLTKYRQYYYKVHINTRVISILAYLTKFGFDGLNSCPGASGWNPKKRKFLIAILDSFSYSKLVVKFWVLMFSLL